MEYENILYDKDGRIARITLNRPAALNALSQELQEELVSAIKDAGEDDNIRVVILKGAGRAFSAGGDIQRRPGEEEAPQRTLMQGRRSIEQWKERLFTIWDLPKPVIAQVHGYCLAMGSVLALTCDLTICAEDAIFGGTSIPLGAGNVSPIWFWHIGPKKTKEIFLQIGARINGKEAERIGLVNRAVPSERLEDEVNKLAQSIARTPLEFLTLQKLVVNRASEMMGLRAIILMGCEIDAVAMGTEAAAAIRQRMKEIGMKATVEEWQRQA
ncbi:MAG: enoyl-CoA hydratase/isomerase family protein [Chloroflexi bacterium]|nr:enoyl-CoA hydratase/isomerase family protein [Chloroflexota bacterium]